MENFRLTNTMDVQEAESRSILDYISIQKVNIVSTNDAKQCFVDTGVTGALPCLVVFANNPKYDLPPILLHISDVQDTLSKLNDPTELFRRDLNPIPTLGDLFGYYKMMSLKFIEINLFGQNPIGNDFISLCESNRLTTDKILKKLSLKYQISTRIQDLRNKNLEPQVASNVLYLRQSNQLVYSK